jgi:hypothetical protein
MWDRSPAGTCSEKRSAYQSTVYQSYVLSTLAKITGSSITLPLTPIPAHWVPTPHTHFGRAVGHTHPHPFHGCVSKIFFSLDTYTTHYITICITPLHKFYFSLLLRRSIFLFLVLFSAQWDLRKKLKLMPLPELGQGERGQTHQLQPQQLLMLPPRSLQLMPPSWLVPVF